MLLPEKKKKCGVNVFESVEEAITDADVVMALRIQLERQKKGLFPSVREYSKFFGIDDERFRLAKKDALLMHPGPVNRGLEVTSEVMDSDNSVINEQVLNGVAVRMGLLFLLTRRGTN